MQRRSVHDRARKDMKDDWTKTCRQLVSIYQSTPNHLCTYILYNKQQQWWSMEDIGRQFFSNFLKLFNDS
jgi:hypothetical protein